MKIIHSPSSWREVLKSNFTQWQQLADFLELSPAQRESIDSNPRFILNLPKRLAEKMAKRDLNDPLLRQFLPTKAEKMKTISYSRDPTGDHHCRLASPKLLQKYKQRVLFMPTSACAMHCRYCFRQNYDYATKPLGNFDAEIAHIQTDSELREAILSGGDPLSLSNELLGALLQQLAAIAHIKRLRIHTRFPIGIPERIDEGLLKILETIPKQQYWIVHVNHPRELDEEVLHALSQVRKRGVPVMSQTVLLKGVNDTLEIQKELSERLVDHGIIPYYLHQLDRVNGSGHFEVDVNKGRELISALSQELSGYAIPRYVAEIYGEPSKTPL